jgi:AraC-like DNA-binding protein/ligand-binding sensor protein
LAPTSTNSKKDKPADGESERLQPLLTLLRSFADIVDVPIKVCRSDGQPLSPATHWAAAGPCSLLASEGRFARDCAACHATGIETARSLARPYIFTCHMRLAAWAIPLFCEENPLSAAIVCGGSLFSEPDAALIHHIERLAPAHGLEPTQLTRSLDETPVLSREYFRAVAGFVFELANAFLARPTREVADSAPPPPAFALVEQPQLSLVFPPQRRTETKRARARKSAEAQRGGAEAEIIRFLREKREDDALRVLMGLLSATSSAHGSPPTEAAEIFTRLFRLLSTHRRLEHELQNRQAQLLKDALGLTRGPEGRKNLARLCRQFITIALELAGGPRPRQVKTIQKYLERNLSKKLTLGTVGERFGLREKPLNELILRNCGMSFTDYVISLRVAEAKHLLRTTDLTFGQIALKTGFTDQSYFTKVFKATAGMTPSEFRR